MILCIIPARLKSTRFPAKLLALAQGKTVLQRTWECAKASQCIDELYVATDDETIASHVRSFGGNVLMTSECPNGTARIIDALRKNPSLQKASIVLNLQGDHPCTAPATLDAIAELLQKDPLADVGTALRKIHSPIEIRSPHIVKCVRDKWGRALYFSRSPIPYGAKEAFQHIGLYAYKMSFLLKLETLPDTDHLKSEDLEQLKFLEWGACIKTAIVEDDAIAVDIPEDLAKLETHLCRSNTSSSQAGSSPRLAKV